MGIVDARLKYPSPAEIKATRSACGFSQTEAAWQTGVTTSAWHHWESGHYRMHPAYLMFFRMRASEHLKEQQRRNAEASAKMEANQAAWDAEHAGGIEPHGAAGPDAVPVGAPGGELAAREGEALV